METNNANPAPSGVESPSAGSRLPETPDTDAVILRHLRTPGMQSDYLGRLNEMIPHARRVERERNDARESLNFQTRLNREVIEREKATHQENERLRKAFTDLMPFVLEDFYPGCSTRPYREAVENACHLLGIPSENGAALGPGTPKRSDA